MDGAAMYQMGVTLNNFSTVNTQGQLISKGLFAILEFFQKTNEIIRS